MPYGYRNPEFGRIGVPDAGPGGSRSQAICLSTHSCFPFPFFVVDEVQTVHTKAANAQTVESGGRMTGTTGGCTVSWGRHADMPSPGALRGLWELQQIPAQRSGARG